MENERSYLTSMLRRKGDEKGSEGVVKKERM
jgi:hypothetical protein